MEAQENKTQDIVKVDVKKVETKLLQIGVQFQTAGKIFPCKTETTEIKLGEQVTIQGERGIQVAKVVEAPKDLSPKAAKEIGDRFVRIANSNDLARNADLREKALEHLEFCAKKIKEHDLPMKLTDAELINDGKKVVFIFFAEQRVDFRLLVKELAGTLRLRIEMRQIGARDETKYRGCLGACGQTTTCCSTFLRTFKSISIGMAKNQGLSPNPAKLTGMCGKLKCCLAYENEVYSESKKGLFKIGSLVETPQGSGKIQSIDILRKKYFIFLDEGGSTTLDASDCERLSAEKKVARERVLAQKKEANERRMTKHRERVEKRQKLSSKKDTYKTDAKPSEASPKAKPNAEKKPAEAKKEASSNASPKPAGEKKKRSRNNRNRNRNRNKNKNKNKG